MYTAYNRIRRFTIKRKFEIKNRSLRKHKFLLNSKFKYNFPFLLFNRKKGERTVLTTAYMKFINYLMRKGLKDRYFTFFYSLIRIYKQKIRAILGWKYNTPNFNNLPKDTVVPSFFFFLAKVFRLITLKVELKTHKFGKAESFSLKLLAPFRGFRLGLNLLFQNSKTRLEFIRRHRKVEYLYKLFSEIWDTSYGQSTTSKDIMEFTDTVLKKTQKSRTRLIFSVWRKRRKILSIGKIYKRNKLIQENEDGILTKFERFKNLKKAKNFLSFGNFSIYKTVPHKISDYIKYKSKSDRFFRVERSQVNLNDNLFLKESYQTYFMRRGRFPYRFKSIKNNFKWGKISHNFKSGKISHNFKSVKNNFKRGGKFRHNFKSVKKNFKWG